MVAISYGLKDLKMGESKEMKTILVIEDNEDFLLAIVENLQKAGYHVICANDGMEGLKLLESATYDLLITDIEIPFISGVGVITALKKRYPSIPAVAITGYGETPLEAAREKRADVVLNKPLEMSTLMGHIHKLLSVNVHS
jgi:CheY-like chemotaxis protein